MARALVTGATGFIGKQLVEALVARGDEAVCLVRASSDVQRLKQLGAKLVIGDVTQPESLPAAVADIDVVYHLAGLTKARSYEDYCRVNEMGVANVLAACAQRNSPPVVILVSSLSAAGAMADERLRVESDPPSPASDYGKSKRAGELVAEAWARNVPITVIRPPIVLGPADEQGVALFRTVKRLGVHLALGLGKRVSAVYVGDLVSAMIAAAEKGERLPSATNYVPQQCESADQPKAPGQRGYAAASNRQVSTEQRQTLTLPSRPNDSPELGRGYYFVAGDTHPRYAELGPMVGRALGKPNVKVVRMPMFMMWISAITGSLISRLAGRPRYMCLDRAKEILAGNWICSADKAARDLGYAPSAPLEEQLRWTAEWYEREGWV